MQLQASDKYQQYSDVSLQLEFRYYENNQLVADGEGNVGWLGKTTEQYKRTRWLHF